MNNIVKLDEKEVFAQIESNKQNTLLFCGAYILFNKDNKPFYVGKTISGLYKDNILAHFWEKQNTAYYISFVDIENLACCKDYDGDEEVIDELILMLKEKYELTKSKRPNNLMSIEMIKKELKLQGLSIDKRLIKKFAEQMELKFILWDLSVCLHRSDAENLIKKILDSRGEINQ